MSRLRVTLTAPLVLITALALGLTVFLNLGKLDRTITELAQSRLQFTVDNLRENLETGLDLGLSVRALGNAQAALDAEMAQDPAIVSITVFESDGAIAFHSGREPADAASARPLKIERSDVVLASLSDNLGHRAGRIELRYARAGHDALMEELSRRLGLAGLAAIAIATLLSILGVRWWLQGSVGAAAGTRP
ncbi:hypothetical protein HSX11_28140 [Oxalobacteraceae bacterium]|nr:hypothetical protein [Oxalobacteraceae bacterium]